MILITGANGHLGSLTIEFFRKKNPEADIAALVRSEEKGAEIKKFDIDLRIGDYLNPESLDNAMEDIETVLLISSSTIENRVQQHKNVIDAAQKANVKQLLYTSMLQADKELSPLAPDHHQTENYLEKTGLNRTIFRHAFYTEFFHYLLGEALETGKWIFPSNGEKANFAMRTEMAEAIANVLAEPESHAEKVYEITSNRAYTFGEYANILSKESGKEIVYTDVSVNDYIEGLKNAGLDDETIGMAKVSAETIAQGSLNLTTSDLQKLLGRTPTDTADYITDFIKQ
jgi:NAD(P)H dehydrogenase (quinone)